MAEIRTPGLEMLWESFDPHDVLRDRFGFRDAESAGEWVASTVHRHWGIGVDACEQIVMSDHNALAWIVTSSERLVAKWSVSPARFARLSGVATLTHWLEAEGLPVSGPLPSADGHFQVEVDDVSMSLQRVIAGDLLDVGNLEQVRTAGMVLARLHQALAAYPHAGQTGVPVDSPEPLATRVVEWLESAGEHVPQNARDALRRMVAEAPTEPWSAQLVHGDIRSSNILCVGPEIAAVIDFEDARFDFCIDEIARSAVLLGTRFQNWGPVSAEVRQTFLSGYESERGLTSAEEVWWNVLVLWYTLAFVPPGDDPTGWGTSALSQLV